MIFIFLALGFMVVVGYHVIYRKLNGHWSYKQCPYCTDVIRHDAIVCKTCYREQPRYASLRVMAVRNYEFSLGDLLSFSPLC